jgi:hypothetical protein
VLPDGLSTPYMYLKFLISSEKIFLLGMHCNHIIQNTVFFYKISIL